MSEITERHIFDEAVRSIIRTDNSELTQIIDDVEDYLLLDTEHLNKAQYKFIKTFISDTVVEYESEIGQVASQIRENMEWSLGLAWSIIQVARGTFK